MGDDEGNQNELLGERERIWTVDSEPMDRP